MQNEYISILMKLNFNHWKEQNKYYSGDEFPKSMQTMLKTIKKHGLLPDFSPESASDIVNEIGLSIKKFDPNCPDYELLEYIFDLIQAWGGRMGRNPYDIQKSRIQFDEWRENYLDGAKSALANKPTHALESWFKIKGIATSFGTKHLKFWSSNKFPVIDARISLLLCGSEELNKKKDPQVYSTFLNILETLAKQFNTTNINDVEKALFAFSSHYFFNNKLIMKKNISQISEDRLLAEDLEKCFLRD
jgi:hypothetical protein